MKKKIFILSLVVILLMPSMILAEDEPISYTDTKDHWANFYIEQLSIGGYLNGYPDNSFKPNEYISYGEFISLFNRMFIPDYKVNQGGEYWYSNDFSQGINAGYLPEGFITNGDDYIKRDEVALLINNYIDLDENEKLLEKFSDRFLIRYPKEVSALVSLGVLEGYPEGDFKPEDPLTRGEMAKVLETSYRKLIKVNERKVSPDEVDLYSGKVAILKEDFILKESYSFLEDEDKGYVYSEYKLPEKYYKNDLVMVLQEEDDMAKFAPLVHDYGRPIGYIPIELLDYNEKTIIDNGNHIIVEGMFYEDFQGDTLGGPFTDVGKVIERRENWIYADFLGGANNQYWVKYEDLIGEDNNFYELDFK